jgi:hypothetical protein
VPRSACNDDQPGLWPLLEAAEEPTAEPADSQHVASAASERRNAKQHADRAPATELEALWHIDDLAAHLGVPEHNLRVAHDRLRTASNQSRQHIRWRPASIVSWAAKQERQAR